MWQHVKLSDALSWGPFIGPHADMSIVEAIATEIFSPPSTPLSIFLLRFCYNLAITNNYVRRPIREEKYIPAS